MNAGRLPILCIALLSASGTAPAQSYVTWGGGFPNDQFSAPTNWVGGTLPLNDGTETLQFNDVASNTDLHLDVDTMFVGITVQSLSGNTYEDIRGGHTLTLGPDGIAIFGLGGTYVSLTLDVPVALGGDQTWACSEGVHASITASKAITGAFALELNSGENIGTFTLNSGSSTFSGGVMVSGSNSTVVLGASSSGPAGAPTSGPCGTGPVSLGDGSALTTSSLGPVAIGNPMTLGDGSTGSFVTLGGSPTLAGGPPSNVVLTLTGPVTLVGFEDPDVGLVIGRNSTVTLAGAVSGSLPYTWLDVRGSGRGTSQLIVQGDLGNISGLSLDRGVTVVLDGSGATQSAGLTEGIETSRHSYLGLGAGYSGAGTVTSFIGQLAGSYSDTSFRGTLGFDTTSGPAATFNDPVDLTNFTNSGFVGLGSATAAILGSTAVITPPSGGNTYYFGGGGGTLTVQSALADTSEESSTNLYLTRGNAPLTLVLSGPLSYTGATSVTRAALIFDTPPASGNILLVGGYAGSTPNSGYTDSAGNIQDFVALFNDSERYGVIGFDSLSGTRTVTSAIDMSETGSGYFLGSATCVVYSGAITPYWSSQYQFSGVKGGQVTIASPLGDGEETPNSAVIGLPDPIESRNPLTGQTSVSSVTLSGVNTYSGGTTLNSGTLYVTNAASLGTGPLTVPGGGRGGQPTLAASGGPVALANPVSIAGSGLGLNSGSSSLLTLSGGIADYGEMPGTLGVFGPVDLEGSNTYSGGTTIATNGATVTVGTGSGLGNGWVTASGSALHFLGASPVVNELSISNSVATFDGSPVINGLQSVETTFNFNGETATINALDSDPPCSGNLIALGSGTVLTLSTTNEENSSPVYHGTITGATGSLVVTGGGMLSLTGSSSYGGGTTLNGETLVIASNNHALGTGAVAITEGCGLITNTGVVLTNPIALGDGGGLGGFGTFSPGTDIAFRNGSILDPGATGLNNTSPVPPTAGKLSFGAGTSLTFGPQGIYWFAISDPDGGAGLGYSTVDLSQGGGTLTLSLSAGNPFTIDLVSIDPETNQPGSLPNFNSAQGYSWTLVSASSLAGSFDPSYFSIDSSGFANSLGAGHFFVSESGNSLMLNFTPVPEPSAWALLAAGLGGLAAMVRRRRR